MTVSDTCAPTRLAHGLFAIPGSSSLLFSLEELAGFGEGYETVVSELCEGTWKPTHLTPCERVRLELVESGCQSTTSIGNFLNPKIKDYINLMRKSESELMEMLKTTDLKTLLDTATSFYQLMRRENPPGGDPLFSFACKCPVGHKYYACKHTYFADMVCQTCTFPPELSSTKLGAYKKKGKKTKRDGATKENTTFSQFQSIFRKFSDGLARQEYDKML